VLAAAGNAAEAVCLLTEANRRRRDRRLEQRIVDLRCEGFRQATPLLAPPPWPEVVEDLTPGRPLPEIARNDLSVAHIRSGLANHGYLIVRGLLSEDRVSQLTADIDTALAAYDACERGEHRPELAGWYEPFRYDQTSDRKLKRARGSVLTVDSPPCLFDLLEAFEEVDIRRLVAEYFGEPPAILAKKATLRRVAPDKSGGWHQDGAFMGAGIRSLNVWIALTHCGDDAPGLDLVARRVDALLRSDGAHAAWGIKATDAQEFGAGAIVRPIFERGDAILFDHLAVHRTAVDAGMTHDRHALETWLFAPSTYGAMTATTADGYSPRDQLPILY
jgi:Phytanoyl-CoA dioxygenase (PhyH)